jgi:acyl-CoA dehydrogenase
MGAQQMAGARMTAEAATAEDLTNRVTNVVAVAAKHAGAVDSASRFPAESFEAVKAQRLLGIMVPRALGGEGASILDAADVCF